RWARAGLDRTRRPSPHPAQCAAVCRCSRAAAPTLFATRSSAEGPAAERLGLGPPGPYSIPAPRDPLGGAAPAASEGDILFAGAQRHLTAHPYEGAGHTRGKRHRAAEAGLSTPLQRHFDLSRGVRYPAFDTAQRTWG